MPTTYSRRYHGDRAWEDDMNTALERYGDSYSLQIPTLQISHGFLDGYKNGRGIQDEITNTHTRRPGTSYSPSLQELPHGFLDGYNNRRGIQDEITNTHTRRPGTSNSPSLQELPHGFLDGYKKRRGIQDEITNRHTRRPGSSYYPSLQSKVENGRRNRKTSNLGSSNSFVPPTPTSNEQGVLDDTSRPITETEWAELEKKLEEEQLQFLTEQRESEFQKEPGTTRISEANWAEMEKKSHEEQRQFLKQWESQWFQKEPVDSLTRNVKRGDHICCPGGISNRYEHHFLCTGVYGDEINVIEYTGSFGVSASSQSSASKNPLAFGKIKTSTFTYQKLKDKKAKIIKWPEELERFTIDETIERAKERGGEQWYNVLENNCEHFVTWCKCGLNTSLQVETWYRPAWEGVKAVGNAGVQAARNAGVEVTPFLVKAVANVSDEVAGFLSRALSPIGFAVGGVIEAGVASWDIYKDYKKMEKGLISQDQFRENTVNTSFTTACRVGGGIAGSIFGSALGPFGSIGFGALGAGVCHYGGYYAITSDSARKLASFVKNTAKKVVTEVKRFFKSLFSWW